MGTELSTNEEYQSHARIPPGRYQHYKGKEYTVIDVARHSETQEEFVVYRLEYGDHSLWIRPSRMFQEMVLVDGQKRPRPASDRRQLWNPQNR